MVNQPKVIPGSISSSALISSIVQAIISANATFLYLITPFVSSNLCKGNSPVKPNSTLLSKMRIALLIFFKYLCVSFADCHVSCELSLSWNQNENSIVYFLRFSLTSKDDVTIFFVDSNIFVMLHQVNFGLLLVFKLLFLIVTKIAF